MGRSMTFRGITINLQEDPRTGVCNGCRAVIGEINAQNGKRYRIMHRHHEIYDDNDPMAYTIEYCPMCHGRADVERPDKTSQYIKRYKPIKVSYQTWKDLTDMTFKDESYDQIIRKCIEAYKREKEHKRRD